MSKYSLARVLRRSFPTFWEGSQVLSVSSRDSTTVDRKSKLLFITVVVVEGVSNLTLIRGRLTGWDALGR
jgi:hypothetical protein